MAPGAQRGDPSPPTNVVAVLVDNSKSMAIADSGGTREAAAKKALSDGLLKGLSEKFQVRLYEFGREPERVPSADSLKANKQATRIGDTLERVMAESSSLPLGADGAAERRGR